MNNPPGRFAITSDITLPMWLTDRDLPETLGSEDEAVALALDLAQANVDHQHGGPFGALLWEDRSKRLLSVGVNLVLPMANPALHAEVVAISLGGRSCLEGSGVTLVTSCEPCIMCLGAAHWAGVSRIVFGALKEDAEAIGFKEGAGVHELRAEMAARGVKFEGGVLRERAVGVLRSYVSKGGAIYGP